MWYGSKDVLYLDAILGVEDSLIITIEVDFFF